MSSNVRSGSCSLRTSDSGCLESAPKPLVTITTRAPFASFPASARVSRSGPRTFTAQMSRGEPV